MSNTATAAALDWSLALPVPETMQAMLFRRFGSPDVLGQDTVDTPHPGQFQNS